MGSNTPEKKCYTKYRSFTFIYMTKLKIDITFINTTCNTSYITKEYPTWLTFSLFLVLGF